jgi:hypothetical protein
VPLLGVATAATPALSSVKDALVMACRGDGDDEGLHAVRLRTAHPLHFALDLSDTIPRTRKVPIPIGDGDGDGPGTKLPPGVIDKDGSIPSKRRSPLPPFGG